MGSGVSTTRQDVEDWEPEDVKKYISELDADLLPLFESKQIDGRALLQYGDKDLVDLGVDATHRDQLLVEKAKHTMMWRKRDLEGAYSNVNISTLHFCPSSLGNK